MSFHGTSSPVSALTRSKRIGLRSRESSMRKCRSTLRSPDISETGTLSRPNERVPLQMGRAMACVLQKTVVRSGRLPLVLRAGRGCLLRRFRAALGALRARRLLRRFRTRTGRPFRGALLGMRGQRRFRRGLVAFLLQCIAGGLRALGRGLVLVVRGSLVLGGLLLGRLAGVLAWL